MLNVHEVSALSEGENCKFSSLYILQTFRESKNESLLLKYYESDICNKTKTEPLQKWSLSKNKGLPDSG